MGRANINTLAGETGIEGERQSKGYIGIVKERERGRREEKRHNDANTGMVGAYNKGKRYY